MRRVQPSKILLLQVASLMLLVLISVCHDWHQQELALSQGTLYRFALGGDPRDYHGWRDPKYSIRLSSLGGAFEASDIYSLSVEDCHNIRWSRRPGGHRLYAALGRDSDGFVHIVDISKEPFSEQESIPIRMMTGMCDGGTLYFRFPFEGLYDFGARDYQHAWEATPRGSQESNYALVRVYGEQAVLQDIYIKGVLLSLPHPIHVYHGHDPRRYWYRFADFCERKYLALRSR